MSLVTLCNSNDRHYGVKAVVAAMEWDESSNPIKGEHVLLKPNFNTADPAPGSTDNSTLEALIDELWGLGAKSITLGERSWKVTRDVIQQKSLAPLLQAKQVELVVFDELPESGWVQIKKPEHHWPDGFLVPRVLMEAECVVETCCLKTHAFGGVFTMSLKLAVGFVPGREQNPIYMNTLHSSPHQREMIAEINTVFSPALVLLDGVDAFVDGGPMTGTRAQCNVMLASSDRIAVDAAGLACLKHLGANKAITETAIFDQEQIRHAVELGLGVSSAKEIQLVSADEGSRDYVEVIKDILLEN
ncbi:MAG: DUF362 domain-containing protein [Deltaproteobacteria bacterium]|nr:DUF362 domain-containing protein [Deltaproteobacteria bacterium]